MPSGLSIAASADLTFHIIGNGGGPDAAPYVTCAFHPLGHGIMEMVIRDLFGNERRLVCDCSISAAELVNWWLGTSRELMTA